MSVEQLLKKRYKVIADYPKSIYPVGEIIDAGWRTGDLLYCDHEGPRMSQFPHLFRELQWYEERKPEDMPEYLKRGDLFYKVEWDLVHGEFKPKFYIHGNADENTLAVDWHFNKKEFLPSTESEYLAFNQQIKIK